MDHASQLARVLVTRCTTLVLATRCLIMTAVLLAVTNSVDAHSNLPNKTVAQAPPVTAGTRAEPCHLQTVDEGSDFLFVPDTFGPRTTYRRVWIGNPQPHVNAHCSR